MLSSPHLARSTTSATLPSSTTTTNHQAGFEERTAANGRVSDLDSYVARTNQLLKFTTKSANNNVDDRHFHHQQQQQEQQPFFITTSTAPTASAAKKRAMRHSYEAQSYAKLSSPEGLYQQSILASARPASASPRSKQFSYAAGPAAVTLPLNSNNYIGGGSIGGVKSSQQQLPTNQLLHSTSEMFYLDRDEEKNLQSYKAELAIIKLNKKVDEMAEEVKKTIQKVVVSSSHPLIPFQIEKLKDVLHGYMVAEEQTYLPKIIKIQAIARGYIVRKKLREYNVFSWHHKKLRCVKDSVFTWDDLLHDCRIISGTRAAFDTVFGGIKGEWRGEVLSGYLNHLSDGIVRIQALMRGALVRRRIKAFWNLNSSSNKIQRLW